MTMSDTTDKTSPDDPQSFQPNQQREELIEEIEQLEETLETKNDELAQVKTTKQKYKQRLERLKRENEKLKQSPLFVATVKDLLDENEVVIKQHGNNQEAVTEVTDEMHDSLDHQDRVAIDNSLNIVKALDQEVDSEARVMHVEESPGISYSDIGGLNEQLRDVREAIELPLVDPDRFDELGIDPPKGVLLHGPPGTGKTMMAKAVANETDASFISLSGSDLGRKFIGEGARLVRDLFETARENEPSVIFIDEIDAIGTTRADSKTSGDAEIQRTLMQLLNEMDGFDERGDVSIIAATNRVDMLDDAIMRPGRFDRLIEVPPPDADGREQIFEIHTRDMNIANDVSPPALAAMVDEDDTGADISAICTEAGMFALRDDRTKVKMSDFEEAYEKLTEARSGGGDVTAPTQAFA